MSDKTQLEVIRPGAVPFCVAGGRLCRGCPGWVAMAKAIAPGGPWFGAAIHCPDTGLTVRPKDSP